jgi:hypothetical protein
MCFKAGADDPVSLTISSSQTAPVLPFRIQAASTLFETRRDLAAILYANGVYYQWNSSKQSDLTKEQLKVLRRLMQEEFK